MFGKRMAGKMGFGQKTKTSDASGAGELVPLRWSHRPETHLRNHSVKKIFQRRRITQRLRGTPKGFDNPFDPVHNARVLALRLAAFWAELRAAGNGFAAFRTELGVSSRCTAGRSSAFT